MINKVFNVDCMGPEGMCKIPDKSVDLILTDIPYNMTEKRESSLRIINKGKANVITFNLNDFLIEVDRVCKGSFYIFCEFAQFSEIYEFFINKSRRSFVWIKKNPSPMNGQHMWLSGNEICVFARNKNSTFNYHCKPNYYISNTGSSERHPTEKPLKLFEYIVKASSNEGDVILDPCAGSGTTAIAAMRTRRNYILFETEKEYFDIINKRIAEEVDKNSLFPEQITQPEQIELDLEKTT